MNTNPSQEHYKPLNSSQHHNIILKRNTFKKLQVLSLPDTKLIIHRPEYLCENSRGQLRSYSTQTNIKSRRESIQRHKKGCGALHAPFVLLPNLTKYRATWRKYVHALMHPSCFTHTAMTDKIEKEKTEKKSG